MLKAVILGAPASGKGTISSRIVKKFQIIHVSSGDILRNHVKNETTIGKEARGFIESGKLVPDNLMMKIMMAELTKLKKESWLLDGFPRTQKQADALFRSHPVQAVINLDVPFEVIIRRVKGRWIHVPSGRVYNTDFNAPKVPGRDDITGEPLEQRLDDKPEAVQKRLEIYENSTRPVLKFYREKGILKDFHGKTSDEIWPKVEHFISEFIKPK